ncbi:cob(I)yrinic acid a,c-diamide adenosyltransferase [Blautia sp. HCP3S3_H10_1]|uniref:cob(I)yrinic acid a,c-diamide adenosyltransferase n=1 Tax=unclassified Blautia TaxID=2648079 RepID=UPI003F921B8F
MSIYTKGGDKGTTSLVHTKNVSKSDDRIQLEGTIDELTSHIGVVKTMVSDGDTIRFLEKIQETLITVMAGVADPYNREYKINDDKTELLEEEIDRLEALFNRPKQFILPGACRLSAEIDVTRTVARRAERALAAVSVKFGSDTGTKKYMNRLADYLYVLARYEDARAAEGKKCGQKEIGGTGMLTEEAVGKSEKTDIASGAASRQSIEAADEDVIQAVLRRIGMQSRITLDGAKKLIEKIEQEALRRGKKAVIAVCGPDGNPIAVHVMDGAFLVSFDVALKKAYTSVAVKMSTMELSKLAQPGGTFYGVDKMDGGRIVIFGGGVPLKSGDTIIGGLGISGGTGEEDHSLAEYALSVLPEIL